MRNLSILCGLIIISLNSCRIIKPIDYFIFTENKVDTFVGEFTKDKSDSNYIKIERQFSKLKVDDNFSEKYELVYKAKIIEGHKVFYALKPKDSIYYDASFGPNHFLFSALIFENKKIYIAPAYDLKDLNRLKYSDFKYFIPEKISTRDTIKIVDRKKQTLLYNFRIDNATIKGRIYRNCLSVELATIWPDTTYHSKVWLQKNIGVLKWIRSTGRVDTRIF